MSLKNRVVVVGGGLVAARCLDELRQGDPDAELVLISEEHHLPYDRPPLTKAALREGTAPPDLNPNWNELAIDTRLGMRAVGLDTARKTVELADGSLVGYGVLVIATGADPRRLPGLVGDRTTGVHVLRSAEDAAAMRADILAQGRITIIGGGFIGCEVATSARTLNAEVILLEALATPLARVLGPQVGALLADRHRRSGVDVRTNAMVAEVRGDGPNRELVLADGTRVPAPVVLVALGVQPSVGWLDRSGLDIKHGVLCNDVGQTSIADVYAAGDVAIWRQPNSGLQVHMEHWTSAASQARTVALAILGTGQPLDEIPYFWSDQVGVMMQMLGRPSTDDEVTIIDVPGGVEGSEKFVALYGRAGRLTAAFGVGAARKVMPLRAKLAAGAEYAQVVADLSQ